MSADEEPFLCQIAVTSPLTWGAMEEWARFRNCRLVQIPSGEDGIPTYAFSPISLGDTHG